MLLLCLVTNSALACSVPKSGFGYSLEELIDNSENIILVELIDQTTNDHLVESRLKVVEVLKGEPKKEYSFISYSSEHESATYLDHNDARFWFNDIGRSAWPCCICGPDHTFAAGFRYLLFPDLLGARKSAEIIKTVNDRWLKFVKQRLDENDS